MNKALGWIYAIGIPVTFAILVAQDIGRVRGWGWLLALLVDAFAALIWPGYWIAAALRALF